jgi:hypothetical protein
MYCDPIFFTPPLVNPIVLSNPPFTHAPMLPCTYTPMHLCTHAHAPMHPCALAPVKEGRGKRVIDLLAPWLDDWAKRQQEVKPTEGGKAKKAAPARLPPRFFTVGRLDVASHGLILVTNDGQWAHKVIHPSAELTKVGCVETLLTLLGACFALREACDEAKASAHVFRFNAVSSPPLLLSILERLGP